MPAFPEPAPILQMRNVSKTFPGVKALRGVQLTIYPGEVHALMGENGAGKSTLMKILSGAYIPDAGAEIMIDGKPVHINGPLAAKAHGIAIIYQELALSPNLTVAENIYLGREARRGPLIDRAAHVRRLRRDPWQPWRHVRPAHAGWRPVHRRTADGGGGARDPRTVRGSW